MLETRSLYRSGSGWLYSLHPLTRLAYTVSVCVVIFLAPGGFYAPGAAGLLSLALAARAGLLAPALKSLARMLLPLGAILLLVHGLFNPANSRVIATIAGLPLGREGVEYAMLLLTRLGAASAASLLFVFTTPPSTLMTALHQAGLAPKATYLLTSPLLLLPQIVSRAQSILASQSARGLETRGNFVQRARAVFPLIAPLIFSVLLDVEERALALELRGFNATGPHTSLEILPDSPAQKTARRAMLAAGMLVAVSGIVWRLLGNH